MFNVIILSLFFILISIPAFAVTKTPARDITTDTTQFGKNIPTSATDVQAALTSLNNLNVVASAAGNSGDLQVNKSGVFGAYNSNFQNFTSTASIPSSTAQYGIIDNSVNTGFSQTHATLYTNGKWYCGTWDGHIYMLNTPDTNITNITSVSSGVSTYGNISQVKRIGTKLYWIGQNGIFTTDLSLGSLTNLYTASLGSAPGMDTDGTYLYVATYGLSGSSFLKINATTGGLVTSSTWTGVNAGHTVLYDSSTPTVFYASAASGHFAKVDTTALTYTDVNVAGNILTDDGVIQNGYMYLGTENTGLIYKIKESDLSYTTTSTDNSYGIYGDGTNMYNVSKDGYFDYYAGADFTKRTRYYFSGKAPNELAVTTGGNLIISDWTSQYLYLINMNLLNIGLGTLTPLYNFHLDGTAFMTGLITNNLVVGSSSGMLKASSGVVGIATPGSDYLTSASLAGYVPYTGATTTVDLNQQNLNNVQSLDIGNTGIYGNSGVANANIDYLGHYYGESIEVGSTGTLGISGTANSYLDATGNLNLLGNVVLNNTVDFATPGTEITVFNDGNVKGSIQMSQANPGVQLTGYSASGNISSFISSNASYLTGGVRQGLNGALYSGFNADNSGNAQLYGGSGTNYQIGINGSGGTGSGGFYMKDANGKGIFSNGTGGVSLTATGTSLLTTGNVGIGTLTTTAPLSVSTTSVGNVVYFNNVQSPTVGGNFTANVDSSGRASLSVIGGVGSSSTGGGYLTTQGYQETFDTLITKGNTSGSQVMRFGNASGSNFVIQRLNDANNSITATPFTMANTAPNNTITIDTNGNVGLGTATSAKKLYVNGAQSVNGTFFLVDQSASHYGDSSMYHYQGNIEMHPAGGGVLYVGNPMNLIGANLGIGTSSPGSLFSVLGGVSIGSYATNAAPAGGFITSGNVGVGTAIPRAQFDVSPTASPTTPFLVTSTGNVGIGTTNSLNLSTFSQLTVAGSGGGFAEFQRFPAVTTNTVGGFTVTNGTNTRIAEFTANADGAVNSGVMTFSTKNAGSLAEVMRITSGANVGIGSTAPGVKLDIQGNQRVLNGNVGIGTTNAIGGIYSYSAAGTADYITQVGATNSNAGYYAYGSAGGTEYGSIRFNNSASGNSSLRFTNDSLLMETGGGAGGGINLVTNANAPIRFATNGATEKVRIDSSGNVGIGSVNPGSQLDITGTIRASGFSGQSAGTLLCVKTGGGIGYCSGVVAGISCTCN